VNARVLNAEDAHSWGLVTEVVDTDAQEHAKAIASRLAAGPSFAFGQARRLVRGTWDVDRVGAGADEAVTISQAVTTPEATALIAKFATT
jgi:2-(1,2-epoxy-1,2-dihydrophenyl)acetyl-CoA isomerase